jgi:hypothetical protein
MLARRRAAVVRTRRPHSFLERPDRASIDIDVEDGAERR